MNRFAANNPERFEDGNEPWDDMRAAIDFKRKEAKENPDPYEQISNAPCCVCAETTTKGGRPCRRCSDIQDDLDSQHVPGRD